jgi:hypothetical protein
MPSTGVFKSIDVAVRGARRRLQRRLRARRLRAEERKALDALLEAKKEMARAHALERRLAAPRQRDPQEVERDRAQVVDARRSLDVALERLMATKVAVARFEAEEWSTSAREDLRTLARNLANARRALSVVRAPSRLSGALLQRKLNSTLLRVTHDFVEAKKLVASHIAQEKRLLRMRDEEKKALAEKPRAGDAAWAHGHEDRASGLHESWAKQQHTVQTLKSKLFELNRVIDTAKREKEGALQRRRCDEATLAMALASRALDAGMTRPRDLARLAEHLEAASDAIGAAVESAEVGVKNLKQEAANAVEWGRRAEAALASGAEELCKEVLARQQESHRMVELLESRAADWERTRERLQVAVHSVAARVVRAALAPEGEARSQTVVERLEAAVVALQTQCQSPAPHDVSAG